jgi:2-C-methyl-D-erythritol 4-phosphate cytidylyltransferase
MPQRAMVVVGGGASTRFGEDKLVVDVGGRPLIAHTIDAVAEHVDTCVVVCRPEIADAVAELADVKVATGGATRTLSEMAGLAAIGQEVDLIGIHDAARPVVDPDMVERLFQLAGSEGGALPLLSYDRLILDRRTHRPVSGLYGAQTPQVFRGADLMAAYVRAAQTGFEGHDTVEVMQRFSSVRIVGVPGDPDNVKVTYPHDLDRVRARLSGSSHT